MTSQEQIFNKDENNFHLCLPKEKVVYVENGRKNHLVPKEQIEVDKNCG